MSGHDPTVEGSGNPGASNVYRVAGPRAGVMVLLGDIVKGFAPALVGLLADGRSLGLAAGLAAMVGHVAPIGRIKRGGKGVATLGGTCLALFPLVSAALIAIWGVVMSRYRKASVGSLVMLGLLPFGVAIDTRSPFEVTLIVAACLLVAFRHYGNIARLIRGREPDIEQGASP